MRRPLWKRCQSKLFPTDVEKELEACQEDSATFPEKTLVGGADRGRLRGGPVQTTRGRGWVPSPLEGQRTCSSEGRWHAPVKARAILPQGSSRGDSGAAQLLGSSAGSCDGGKQHQGKRQARDWIQRRQERQQRW